MSSSKEGRRWTGVDVNKLEEMITAKTPVFEMAKTLERSEEEVQRMIIQIKGPSWSPGMSPANAPAKTDVRSPSREKRSAEYDEIAELYAINDYINSNKSLDDIRNKFPATFIKHYNAIVSIWTTALGSKK
jgi:hypothetical protein